MVLNLKSHCYYGITYPCIYVLLHGKSRAVYDNMLQKILDLFPDGAPVPDSIMVDFEDAAIKSFRSNFPATEVTGCYFHLAKSFWRKIKSLKLEFEYLNNPSFKHRVRRFLTLAFVPLHEVHDYMQLLIADEANSNAPSLNEFILYLQKYYVGQVIN